VLNRNRSAEEFFSISNALAETINGLYKTEVIRQRGPWRNIEDVEFATLTWVDWFNHRNVSVRETRCRLLAGFYRFTGLSSRSASEQFPASFTAQSDFRDVPIAAVAMRALVH
jgi:hypothetical protein